MNISNHERLMWVDVMRGFSILLVVYAHVMAAIGILPYDSFLTTLFYTFRLPLFFFVSGFFSFRAIKWWNRHRIFDILKRKVQAQIFCTVVFCSVYQYVVWGGVNLLNGFAEYWFTIVLFQMYLMFLILSLISRLIKIDIVIIGLVILSILGIVTLTMFSRSGWWYNFLCWENLCKYMQYFTLGIICAKLKSRIFALLDKNIFILTVTLGWILCMIIWYNEDIKILFPHVYSFVHDIAVRYFGLLTIVSLFFGFQPKISDSTLWSNTLGFVGQRTLDIYMIHYFFIPQLSDWSPWLLSGNRIIFQLGIGIFITFAITILSLVVSYILRRSSTLESWLFGIKRRQI